MWRCFPLQIKSFIDKLGLGCPDSTSKGKRKVRDSEMKVSKESPTETTDRKKRKKVPGHLSEKKEKHKAESPRDVGGSSTNAQLEKMLLSLSAQLHKKPLVSLDSEQPLLNQVMAIFLNYFLNGFLPIHPPAYLE